MLFRLIVGVFSLLYVTKEVSAVDWETYNKTAKNFPPHRTLILAQKYFELEKKTSGFVIDLGAGGGKDTLFLLNKGWSVLALDQDEKSLQIIKEQAGDLNLEKLQLEQCAFSEMVLPESVDLINASNSLPFCNPVDFSECWEKIVNSLAVGGRFSGNFFGENDGWNDNTSMTFQSHDQVLDLFKEQFIIEYIQIEEGLIPTFEGSMKHWHVFHIVAKKIKNP